MDVHSMLASGYCNPFTNFRYVADRARNETQTCGGFNRYWRWFASLYSGIFSVKKAKPYSDCQSATITTNAEGNVMNGDPIDSFP